MNPPIETPGPDHPITISREAARVRVLFNDHLLGESVNVLVLREFGYPPVRYFPRADIEMAFLERNSQTAFSPYLGEALYYNLHRDGEYLPDVIWSYEAPHPAVAQIAGHMAFYPENIVFEIEPLTRADAA